MGIKRAVSRSLRALLPRPAFERARMVGHLPGLVRCSRICNSFVLRSSPPVDTGKILWVATERISDTALNYEREDQRSILGSVRGGDWDLVRESVDDLRVIRFLDAHFTHGTDLRTTPFYNPHITTRTQHKAAGFHTWDFITAYEYDDRMRRIRALYESMKRDGYRTQQQLGGDPLDEIIVKIGRKGEILFVNSVHRLAIARILGIPKVPVIVSVRHRDWMVLKKQLTRYATHVGADGQRTTELYQRIVHPDLESIPYKHGGDDRLQIVTEHIRSPKGSTVLDIGANLGFFSFALARIGYVCDAVEYGPLETYLLQSLSQLETLSVNIVSGDVLDPALPLRARYDIVLAFNVFHHFLKERTQVEMLRAFLKRVHMKELFFSPHDEEEYQMQTAYLNLSNDEFLVFVKENSGMSHHEYVGDVMEGRKVFHIWE